jgi:hypothetical protein
MMTLLVLRERIKKFYKENDIYILPAIKFVFALIVFQTINSEIGYDSRLKSFLAVMVLSALSAFSPTAIAVLLAAAVVIAHVYFISPILSIIIVIIMLVLYLLFARYTPNLGYIVMALPILYVLKIPYLIPILLGMAAAPIAIIPMGCGIILYFVLQIIKTAASMQVDKSIGDILQLYTYVIDSLVSNKLMILTFVVFALILLITYAVRKMKIDYAFEISIAAGTLTSILGILVSYIILNKTDKILSMIFGSIISSVIAYGFHFFVMTLDYSAVEYVQFEDDSYYYYVKAVPKVTVTTPKKDVKHINSKDTGSLHENDRQDMDEENDNDDIYLDKNDDFISKTVNNLYEEEDLYKSEKQPFDRNILNKKYPNG